MKSTLTILLFVIAFLSLSVLVQAQNRVSLDSVTYLPKVTVTASLDESKYLWNLLKTNYRKSINDTNLYYSINYSIEVPDSGYHEKFSGVILVQYINNKHTIYVCEGLLSIQNSMSYNDFHSMYYGIYSIWKIPKELERYNKFKKHIITYEKANNLFKVINDSEKKLRTEYFLFDKKTLQIHNNITEIEKILINFTKLKGSSNVEYYSSNIITNFTLNLSYKFKDLYVKTNIYIQGVKNKDYKKNGIINSETPSSIYDKLKIYKKEYH